MREAKEDPDLAEVKAVLKELQRLDLTGDEVTKIGDPQASRPFPAALPSKAGIAVFDRKRAAIEAPAPRPTPRRRLPVLLIGAGAAAVAGAVVLLATGLVQFPGDAKAPAFVRQKGDDAVLLAEARRLISEGDVALARSRLLSGGSEARAELAFMLAQSYDPNYLRTLAKANVLPDRAQAERWYRKWYELAVASGLEMDSERLMRIINAMH